MGATLWHTLNYHLPDNYFIFFLCGHNCATIKYDNSHMTKRLTIYDPAHPWTRTRVPTINAADLQSYRQRLGLSQEALAQLLGVHKLTVSHWETGAAASPGYLPLALAAIHRAIGGSNVNVQ
jgi:DNA-binding transcriptional regulator YiaG